MSITTHVQALTTALNAIDNHLASMLDHGVTPDQYKAIEPDLIALEIARIGQGRRAGRVSHR